LNILGIEALQITLQALLHLPPHLQE